MAEMPPNRIPDPDRKPLNPQPPGQFPPTPEGGQEFDAARRRARREAQQAERAARRARNADANDG